MTDDLGNTSWIHSTEWHPVKPVAPSQSVEERLERMQRARAAFTRAVERRTVQFGALSSELREMADNIVATWHEVELSIRADERALIEAVRREENKGA